MKARAREGFARAFTSPEGPPRGGGPWKGSMASHRRLRRRQPFLRYPKLGNPGTDGPVRGLADLDRAVLHREGDRLELGMDPELPKDVPDVGLDGLGADE